MNKDQTRCRQALLSLVCKPCPKTWWKPFWWWSKRVVRASNVDDCVEGLEKVGVPGSDNVSAGEAFGEAKHEAGEGLVAVEGSVCVCPHASRNTMLLLTYEVWGIWKACASTTVPRVWSFLVLEVPLLCLSLAQQTGWRKMLSRNLLLHKQANLL